MLPYLLNLKRYVHNIDTFEKKFKEQGIFFSWLPQRIMLGNCVKRSFGGIKVLILVPRTSHLEPREKSTSYLEKREGDTQRMALSSICVMKQKSVSQNTTGPRPIQLVVPSAVSAAVAAAMRIRSPISQMELLPLFMVHLLSWFSFGEG